MISSISIDTQREKCRHLRKRSNYRSFTPNLQNIIRPASTEPVENKPTAAISFKYDRNSRKITVPLIGDIILRREEFHLISPKALSPEISFKNSYKNYEISDSTSVQNFLKESKEMFGKKKNYWESLRKCIQDVKVFKIPKNDIPNLRKYVFHQPFEHEKARVFLKACKCGVIKTIRNFIREFPQIVNCFDDTHMTGLHWSALRGNIDVAELLIANNAYINAVDIAHRTPLFIAVKTGDFEVIRFFLVNKADPLILSDSKQKLVEYAKNHAVSDLLGKAVLYQNLMKRTPYKDREEKWKSIVVPAFLRMSAIAKEENY